MSRKLEIMYNEDAHELSKTRLTVTPERITVKLVEQDRPLERRIIALANKIASQIDEKSESTKAFRGVIDLQNSNVVKLHDTKEKDFLYFDIKTGNLSVKNA